MSSPLKQNTTTIQELLNKINSLPEEVILPELTNPADASKALSGYEFINEDGEKVTGTIPTKTASDLTASGATVTVPAGYYASQTTKSVTTATQATPSISIDSAGKITATATQTAGYVAAGTKSGTKQLTTQAAQTITPGTTNKTIASGTYLTGTQTIKGDANLVAANIKSGVSIFGVTGTASGGSSGGTDVEDAIITKTIGSYSNDRVKNIGDCAFYDCTSLTTVSFPAATTIGYSAFYNCNSLTTVSFPVATRISNGAFRYCHSLTTVSFPTATTISNGAFGYCSRLTTVNFPVATMIGASAFYDCTSLTTVSFPAATTIGASAFYDCTRLSRMYLLGSSVCKLSASNALSQTPFAGNSNYFSGTPYIYVPSALLTSYKTATNWTYFSKYMRAY